MTQNVRNQENSSTPTGKAINGHQCRKACVNRSQWETSLKRRQEARRGSSHPITSPYLQTPARGKVPCEPRLFDYSSPGRNLFSSLSNSPARERLSQLDR